MRPTLLIVEDNKDLAQLMKMRFEHEGFNVLLSRDGAAGLDLARRRRPDLLILDIMLPDMSGTELFRSLRLKTSLPVIFLTGKAEVTDRVVGLELGADDYVTKPFAMPELVSRVKAVLRRTLPGEARFLRAGNLALDEERRETTLKGRPVALSSKEFGLLSALFGAQGKAVSRGVLLSSLWGYKEGSEINTRALDMLVARLRRKLGPESSRVVTVPRLGYRLKFD